MNAKHEYLVHYISEELSVEDSETTNEQKKRHDTERLLAMKQVKCKQTIFLHPFIWHEMHNS